METRDHMKPYLRRFLDQQATLSPVTDPKVASRLSVQWYRDVCDTHLAINESTSYTVMRCV